MDRSSAASLPWPQAFTSDCALARGLGFRVGKVVGIVEEASLHLKDLVRTVPKSLECSFLSHSYPNLCQSQP